MDITKRFITGAVGMLLAIAACVLMITVYRKGNAGISASIDKYDSLIDGIESSRYDSFITVVRGSAVLEAIEGLTYEDTITITVRNSYNLTQSDNAILSTEYTYQGLHTKNSELLMNARNKSDPAHYINPSGRFKGSYVYDANGTVTGIMFAQEG
ncbi:MAG: hypothetical protein K6B75_08025 [Lachnospiraceae bacterium]|nr:hypothetical protein [Lachnospiraceae bacterium]